MAKEELYNYDIYSQGQIFNVVGDEITEANEMCIIIRCEGIIVFMTTEPYTIVNLNKYVD